MRCTYAFVYNIIIHNASFIRQHIQQKEGNMESLFLKCFFLVCTVLLSVAAWIFTSAKYYGRMADLLQRAEAAVVKKEKESEAASARRRKKKSDEIDVA